MTDDLRAEQNNALLALASRVESLTLWSDQIDGIERESIVSTLRTLATRPAEASSPVSWECRVVMRDGGFGQWEKCTHEMYEHIRVTGHYNGPGGARCEVRALYTHPATHRPDGGVTDGCMEALCSYKQADEEGVFVTVSREALDQAIAAITRAQTVEGPHFVIPQWLADQHAAEGAELPAFVHVQREIPTTPHQRGDAVDAIAARIVRDVAELPDRNSPENWPEAMLVTSDELLGVVRAALATPANADDGEG